MQASSQPQTVNGTVLSCFMSRNCMQNALCRYGDGYIMVGFSHGFLVVVSTHMKEIGHVCYSHNDRCCLYGSGYWLRFVCNYVHY